MNKYCDDTYQVICVTVSFWGVLRDIEFLPKLLKSRCTEQISFWLQGQFPHGIDILSTCDYFAVGNRIHCYLELRYVWINAVQWLNCFLNPIWRLFVFRWIGSLTQFIACCDGELTIHCTVVSARDAVHWTPQNLCNSCVWHYNCRCVTS